MYNCIVLHGPNVGKFGWGTWASAKKKKNKKKEGKTLVHDPGLTPPLVQVHGLGPQTRISAWGT